MRHANRHSRTHLLSKQDTFLLLACLLFFVFSSKALSSGLFNAAKPLNIVENKQWQGIYSTNKSNNTILATNGDLTVFQLNVANEEVHPVIKLQEHFSDATALQALVTHPNFNQQNNYGYKLVYSAHIQTKQERTNRFQTSLVKEDSHAFSNELVITEWSLQEDDNAKYSIKEPHRIVVKFPIPAGQVSVATLAFNPFIKSWQKGFGYLHIALSSRNNQHQDPLFSGAVLRINPQPFGLNGYSIPASNPFKFSSEIADELIAIGLGNFSQILWVKDNVNQLLKVTKTKQETQIYKLDLATDGRESNEGFIQVAKLKNVMSAIYYLKLALLDNHSHPYVFLQSSEQSTSLSAINGVDEHTPIVLNYFPSDLSDRADDNILIENNGGLTLFSLDKSTYIAVAKEETQKESNIDTNQITSDSDRSTAPWILGIFLFLLVSFLIYRAINHSTKLHLRNLLYSNFANMNLDENGLLHFYERHEKEISKTIKVSDIENVTLLLNEEELISIGKHSAFSNELQQFIEEKFKKEKRDKMVDGRIRQIKIRITLENGIILTTCLYMRKGNVRLTKRKFFLVEEAVTNILWAISSIICPEETEERLVHESSNLAKDNTLSSSELNTTSSSKPWNSKPSLSQDSSLQKELDNSQTSTPQSADIESHEAIYVNETQHQQNRAIQNESTQEDPIKEPEQKVKSKLDNDINHVLDASDIELIESLSKLADLKEKGFLTEQEYQNSKHKVLKKLSEL